MWKIAVGFIAFAGLALFILGQGGEIDMGGEKHGEPIHVDEKAPAAKAAAPAAPVAPAPAASAAK
jgi:hypothetical protein